MPSLDFRGSVILVQTLEEDRKAYEELSKATFVGIDFEWQPDLLKTNHPLSLAQVSTHTHCYIWCLFMFDAPCPGLSDLLYNDSIKKVGCGFRTNDLKKLEVSGYALLPTRDLPPGFEDIQDYKHPTHFLAWKNLKFLLRCFCNLEYVEKKLDVRTINWRNIAKDNEMLKYAVLDAYSVVLIHDAHVAAWKTGKLTSGTLVPSVLPPVSSGQQISSHEYASQMSAALFSEMITEMHSCETEVFQVSFHSVDSASKSIINDGPHSLVSDSAANSVVMRLEGESASAHFYPGCRLQLFNDILCDPREDLLMEAEPTLIEGTYFFFDLLDDFHRFHIEIDGREIYYVKRKFNPIPFQRQLNAIQGWVNGVNPLLERIILGSDETAPADNTLHNIDRMDDLFSKAHGTHPMNPSQRAAVHFAVSRDFSMIHGPPGTGKSHTLTSLVHYLFTTQPKEDRILVCAPSNEATDHLARRLIEALGSAATENLCVIKSRSRIRFYRRDIIAPRIWSGTDDDPEAPPPHRIVCCTLSMSGGNFLQDERFKYVIIDEASQCLETECLVAVAHNTQHLILAGDHKQLGPVVLSQEAKDAQLERSLFERLMQTQGANGVQLQIQYRMHPDISIWPNTHFYDSKIEDGVTEKDRELSLPISKILQVNQPLSFPSPNIFIDIRGVCSKTRLGSSSNKAEAIAAMSLFINLTRVGVGKVVILTPYLGQAAEINLAARQLKLKGFNNRSVAYTISQFQGQEADVVILTLVRSLRVARIRGKEIKEGISMSIGFTSDPKRINVGLTRAKRAMFVLGDASLLKNDPLWLSALSHYANKKSIFHGTPGFGDVPSLSLSELPSQDINQLCTPTLNFANGAQDLLPNGQLIGTFVATTPSSSSETQASYSNVATSSAPVASAATPSPSNKTPNAVPKVNSTATLESEPALVVAPRVPDAKRPQNHKATPASPNATKAHVVMLQQWLELNHFPRAVITPWRKNREVALWTCTLIAADHRFHVTGSTAKTAIYGACLRALELLDTDFQVLPNPTPSPPSNTGSNGKPSSSASETQTTKSSTVIPPKTAAADPLMEMNRFYSISVDLDSIFTPIAEVAQRSASQAVAFGKLPAFSNVATASPTSSSAPIQAARAIQPSSSQPTAAKSTPAQSSASSTPAPAKKSSPAPTLQSTWAAFSNLCHANVWTAVSYTFNKSKNIICNLVVRRPSGVNICYTRPGSSELEALRSAIELAISKHDLRAPSAPVAAPSQTAAPSATPTPAPAASPAPSKTHVNALEDKRWRAFVGNCAEIGGSVPQKTFKGTSAPFTCTVQFRNADGKTITHTESAQSRIDALTFASSKLLRKEVARLLCVASPWADSQIALGTMDDTFIDAIENFGWSIVDMSYEEFDDSEIQCTVTVLDPSGSEFEFVGNTFRTMSKAHASATSKALAHIRARAVP